ncbi:patatin-like phospholipase family protein [Vibrio chagasii]|uniref:patatin-like phospholipase family protein n=1 Tax=Vibrio chagasii TaxID=170679 RepID=UPI003BB797C3
MNIVSRRTTQRVVVCATLSLILGCSTAVQRNVSAESEWLYPLDTRGLRFWDESDTDIQNYNLADEFNFLLANKPKDEPVNYLALSGGGVNGAFSAGILNAWSEKGTKPDFDIVTGVSTGAIVSVFAFLGSDFDSDLKHYYTQTTLDEMFKRQSLFKLISSTSIVDVAGFEKKVRNAITPELMARLADQRGKGKILVIATTNLDNEKMALWDIGRIAQVGTSEAQTLIQDIVIASSSIPGFFPAKLISLPHRGGSYDELHVDGGVSRQVFLIPQWVRDRKQQSQREQNIYVIRNGAFNPKFKETENGISSVSIRSLSTLLRRQGIADVEYIYHYSKLNQFNFQLAHIDADFDDKGLDPFSLKYMNEVYNYGHRTKQKEQLWQSKPPSIQP